MTVPLLQLKALSFGYPCHPILEGLDLALHAGERLALPLLESLR